MSHLSAKLQSIGVKLSRIADTFAQDHIRHPDGFGADLQDIWCGNPLFARFAHGPLFFQVHLQFSRLLRNPYDERFSRDLRFKNEIYESPVELTKFLGAFLKMVLKNFSGGFFRHFCTLPHSLPFSSKNRANSS